MPNTKVLVVDDSAAMRALFCDILDNAKDVEVCGTASNADEARDKIFQLRPDVLTLDVEMPGKSGLDFLAEIMEEAPMPVIMLSSIAQAGSGTAQKALDLGAVHCFPKPLHSSREEFDATVQKLGGIVLKAASGELVPGGSGDNGAQTGADYAPDGKLVTLASGEAGLDAVHGLLAAYPENCPPTLILIDAEASAVQQRAEAMSAAIACKVETVADGTQLMPGTVYLAFDRSAHVIIEAGEPPRARLVPRDPVGGFRPSADLLFGSLARAGLPAVGGLLAGTGRDGAKGMQILSGTGIAGFVEVPERGAPRERLDAARELGLQADELKAEMIADWVLEVTAAKP